MRAEVLLMSSNVRFIGDRSQVKGQGWGCQFLTGDHDYESGGDIFPSYGELILDNVEFYNCSQQDTYKAAIRFDMAQNNTVTKKVSNSVIHHGLGWGIQISSS